VGRLIMDVAVLAGGVGGAKLAWGLSRLLPPERLTVIVNTGDDFDWHGLRICPDLDTVIYTLAGIASSERGWGIEGDTFRMRARLEQLGCEAWFQVGDLDAATHLLRTGLLRGGASVTEVARELCRRNGVEARVLPMSDDPVATRLDTDEGTLEFQEYFVRRACAPQVRRVFYAGIERARAASGVKEALLRAGMIVIAPSNPYLSTGPILALEGVREILQARRSAVRAVSPIAAGKAYKGPAASMMRQMGEEASPLGIARLYSDLLGALFIDPCDEGLAPSVAALGIRCIVRPISMNTGEEKVELASSVLRFQIAADAGLPQPGEASSESWRRRS